MTGRADTSIGSRAGGRADADPRPGETPGNQSGGRGPQAGGTAGGGRLPHLWTESPATGPANLRTVRRTPARAGSRPARSAKDARPVCRVPPRGGTGPDAMRPMRRPGPLPAQSGRRSRPPKPESSRGLPRPQAGRSLYRLPETRAGRGGLLRAVRGAARGRGETPRGGRELRPGSGLVAGMILCGAGRLNALPLAGQSRPFGRTE